MARVRLLVTMQRGVGWGGGGDGGGGDDGGNSGNGWCDGSDDGGNSGGGNSVRGGDGVEALVRPCGRAPTGTGVCSVYPSGAFSGP